MTLYHLFLNSCAQIYFRVQNFITDNVNFMAQAVNATSHLRNDRRLQFDKL